MNRHGIVMLGLVLGLGAVGGRAQEAVTAVEPYGAVAEVVTEYVDRQRKEMDIPSVVVALVDDQKIVWARGFGLADRAGQKAATAETVVRVGSVSKLYTDIALMQIVEQGLVDLDEPVSRYLPEFHPKNPFGTEITLRQIVAHRAGLVREPPVGHYFDPTEPSLAESVASLNGTTLVYRPGTKTKYSNAGLNVVGRVVEVVRKKGFSEAVGESVLGPLGMSSSSFRPDEALRKRMAIAQMWTYDGRTFDAPTFDLGLEPAGNLAGTVIDQARFLSALFAGGEGAKGRILKAETLERMWKPQDGGPFGIGFHVDRFEGRRMIGHSGAVYGFATSVVGLPDEKLGAVVVATKDCANEVASQAAYLALRGMLAARKGDTVTTKALEAVPEDEARRLAGPYRGPSGRWDLEVREGRLMGWNPESGLRVGFRREPGKTGLWLVGESPLVTGPVFQVEEGGLKRVDGEGTYERIAREEEAPPAPRESWQGLIGEYGWDHNVLYILEKQGKLYALIEWFFLYPLEEVERDQFRFPDRGLYAGEAIRFERGGEGRASKAVLADSVVFERREVGTEEGRTFQIKPAEPVEVLRAKALKAAPPAEQRDFRKPELVDLAGLDPTIKLDVRYAGTNNFLGAPMYSSSRAFLQRPAAKALLRAHQELKIEGYGLLIHDAYRPWYVTRMFWDATRGPDRGFVADPEKGSRHNRGCAVDLSMYDLKTGEPVRTVSGYDEFSARARPDYPGGTGRERWLRDRLRRAMERQGFTVNEGEWWHFDYRDWPVYPILNTRFEDLPAVSEVRNK